MSLGPPVPGAGTADVSMTLVNNFKYKVAAVTVDSYLRDDLTKLIAETPPDSSLDHGWWEDDVLTAQNAVDMAGELPDEAKRLLMPNFTPSTPIGATVLPMTILATAGYVEGFTASLDQYRARQDTNLVALTTLQWTYSQLGYVALPSVGTIFATVPVGDYELDTEDRLHIKAKLVSKRTYKVKDVTYNGAYLTTGAPIQLHVIDTYAEDPVLFPIPVVTGIEAMLLYDATPKKSQGVGHALYSFLNSLLAHAPLSEIPDNQGGYMTYKTESNPRIDVWCALPLSLSYFSTLIETPLGISDPAIPGSILMYLSMGGEGRTFLDSEERTWLNKGWGVSMENFTYVRVGPTGHNYYDWAVTNFYSHETWSFPRMVARYRCTNQYRVKCSPMLHVGLSASTDAIPGAWASTKDPSISFSMVTP